MKTFWWRSSGLTLVLSSLILLYSHNDALILLSGFICGITAFLIGGLLLFGNYKHLDENKITFEFEKEDLL